MTPKELADKTVKDLRLIKEHREKEIQDYELNKYRKKGYQKAQIKGFGGK